jgi:prephenate dehydratase
MTKANLERTPARRVEERRSHARGLRTADPSPSALGHPVAFPGPVGTHTSSAAAALFPSARLLPLSGFRAVADAVAGGEVGHGVLPIESSLVGPVAETHDLLYERALSIVAETVLPIRHCLAGPSSVEPAEIRIVRSHPTALDQCRDLLARLPHASVIPAATTAEAARLVAERGEPGEVAIVGPAAVQLYGLTVLEDDIGDHTAFTRFVSIAPQTRLDVPFASARTALSFATRHQPGALHAAIGPFADAGLDLQRLVARPLPATPWKYRFDAVVSGHPLEPALRTALREMKAVTRELRVLGVYEAHEEKA